MKRISWLDVALTVLATAWLGFHVVRFPAWTVDDAFIVARYADNAVTHGELAFNAGAGAADRVEGFTSVLAMLVALLARVVKADPIAATKLVCVAAALFGPALVAWLARSMRASSLTGGLAAVLFAIHPEHAIHARSGLETELFVACSLGLFVAFAQLLDGRRKPTAFVALALLTALARPEGIALVTILGAGALRFVPNTRRRALLRSIAVGIAAPLAVLAVARFAYYDALVPNTFYAKHGTWNVSHASDLGALLDVGVVDVAAIALVAWLLARIARGTWVRLPPRVAIASTCALVALLVHVVAYARSEPIMDYGRRFAWHGIAFVVVGVIAALDVAVRSSARLARRPRGGAAVVAVLAFVAAFSGAVRAGASADRERAFASRQSASVGPLHEPTIEWVSQNTAKDAVVAVYPDAGRLPFVTGRRTIDFGKLNDRVLARAGSDAEVVRYFFERRPDVAVFGRKASGRLFDSGAEAVVADARFAAEYELARRVGGGSAESEAYEIYRRVTR